MYFFPQKYYFNFKEQFTKIFRSNDLNMPVCNELEKFINVKKFHFQIYNKTINLQI